jgi:predicted small secreted protein
MIKKLAALVVLVMVAAIFVAGCDNKNPTNTSAGVAVTVNAQTTAWSTSQRRKEGSSGGCI